MCILLFGIQSNFPVFVKICCICVCTKQVLLCILCKSNLLEKLLFHDWVITLEVLKKHQICSVTHCRATGHGFPTISVTMQQRNLGVHFSQTDCL